MNLWLGFLLFVLELILIAASCVAFHELGYQRGWDEGYKLGRIDADNWWLEAQRESNQVRQEIWKEHT